ncbi:hypothetical protein ACF0H5_008164 [Mactra antiquata]
MTKSQETGLSVDNMPEIPDYSANYDGYARLSPAFIEPVFEDPYRCPVSTPTVSRQHSSTNFRHTQGPFIAFTSLNRSLQIPNHISTPKHSKYRNVKTRPVAKPQKKNFDCYFVKNVDKNIHIDAQTHGSTWLNTLCAQPVDEIFGKYKRKSEVNYLSRQTPRSKNSTPGEKALMSAWSSNASNRGTPSVMSKSNKSIPLTASRKSSKSVFVEPNVRAVGFDPDPDRFVNNIGFALVPVPSPTGYDTDDATFTMTSSRDSPVFQRVFRNNYTNQPNDAVINNTYYEPYQRDKRFPEIRRRKSALSPTRRRIPQEAKEAVSTSVTNLVKQDLEESPIHIVTIGQAFRNSPEPIKSTLPVSRQCSYRLPKSLSMSLPELHGAG